MSNAENIENFIKNNKLIQKRKDATLDSAVLQAASFAKRDKQSYFVYKGSSYMSLIHQVTYKKSNAQCKINNIGGYIIEIKQDMSVSVITL